MLSTKYSNNMSFSNLPQLTRFSIHDSIENESRYEYSTIDFDTTQFFATSLYFADPCYIYQ